MKLPSIRSLVIALLGALAFGGCAEERAPINRVQPNALAKAFFVGSLTDESDDPEFYFRSTIVDVDFGTTQALLYAPIAASVSRIHWEITEDLLLARLSYDRVSNTTTGSDIGALGVVVAAFPIESHFDIQREYNPQTGEELNIVVENTSDRPWYTRDYMRVDWSQNLVTTAYDFDILSIVPLITGDPMTYEPVSYFVEDPKSPDAPVFSREDHYFDVTNKIYARPETMQTPWGAFPLCFFQPDVLQGTYPEGNCNPSEVKVRLSFRRVEDTDYEPIDWDGQRKDMFGIIDGTIRNAYDRNYGIVNDKWYRFASRHNIWEQSHAHTEGGALVRCYTSDTTPAGADPQRDDDRDGTQDECAVVGNGSRCDPYTHACTLPYADRRIRPIRFYFGLGSEPSFFEQAAGAVDNWDGALRHAVQTARFTECLHVAGFQRGDIDQCAQDFSSDPAGYANCARSAAGPLLDSCREKYPTTLDDAMQAVPRVAMLCHNPVTSADNPACGAPGLTARLGDIRYHLITAFHDPMSGMPWGVMVDGQDPLTGMVVDASVSIFDASTDRVVQDTIDKMRWQLGELTNAQAAGGNYAQSVSLSDGRLMLHRNPPLMNRREIEERFRAMDGSLDGQKTPLPGLNEIDTVKWAANLTASRFGDQILGRGNAPLVKRLGLAKQSGVELDLLTEPFLQMGNVQLGAGISSTLLDQISPLRGSFYTFRAELDEQHQLALAQTGRCELEAPEPTDTGAWARIMNLKFPLEDEDTQTPGVQASAGAVLARNDRWRDFLTRQYRFSVISHEIGHSLGLEHNFTSSADALNYRTQYWQLRTRDGKETDVCVDATDDGSTCIGPRWLDPVTPEEDEGLINRWSHTSVMDYPGELTQDSMDISAYDRAAIRFAYGNVTDVWDDPSVSCVGLGSSRRCTTGGALLQDRLDSFGGILGPAYGFGTSQAIHYSELNNMFGLVRNCRDASEEELSPPPNWDEQKDGVYVPEFDAKIVNGTICDGPPVDYVSYADLEFDQVGVAPTQTLSGGEVRKFDPMGRVRRPYLYAGDEWADLGNVAVYRHDNGADPYEVTHFLSAAYEDNHLFENHRRNRTSFGIRPTTERQLSRYHFKLMEMGKAFAFLNEIFAGAGVRSQLLDLSEPRTDASQPFPSLEPNALAATLSFDHFARMLTRPSAGVHRSETDATGDSVLRNVDQIFTENAIKPVVIPEGTTLLDDDQTIGGRPLHNSLDETKGYYASDYTEWVGSYYDKSWATALLTDSFDRFIPNDRETFFDGRYRNIGMATLFPDGVRRLIGTSLTEDKTMLGWRVAGTLNGAGGVDPLLDRDNVVSAPFGQRAWWAADPGICWPAKGRVGCFDFAGDAGDHGTAPPEGSIAVDPEVGFEIQKFVVFWSMLYLPESWKLDWVDMMRIWAIGLDSDPAFPADERRAWRDPTSGQLYVAHSYGQETIDGRDIDRGIAARVIEWMNLLTSHAYQVDDTDADTGELTIAKYPDNDNCPDGVSSCKGQPILASTRDASEYVMRVKGYKTVIDYLRSVTAAFAFDTPNWRGIYQ